ncbi:MFS transporter [Roseiarcus sp.]|uniref:MFS transporter n=1 Tax=Roseiarcus sp. TaxID=1969460 RepID=UPI003F9E398A
MTSQSTVNADNAAPSPGERSRWGVFGNLAFTVILIASSVSNVGIAMFDTSMSWLMTSLNPDPMMVSAVQVATMLPMFLLTLPAGALADIVDARRLLFGAQAAVALISIAFAVVVSAGLATPTNLLLTTFALGVGGAIAAPVWQLVTPKLVPKDDLDSAIAINNASYSVSRAIGPAVGGFAIAAWSIDVPFWCYVAGNLAIAAAVVWWHAPRRVKETLPAERFTSAVRTGLRYVRHNRDMDSTLIRAVAFFLFGSAYWALLPLIARSQMHNGAALYGALLGMIGLGSILGSVALNWLKERLGPDGLAAMASVGTIAALVMYAGATASALAMAASLVAGACWTVMMTTLFVSAQVALPDWVRGRGLAILLTAYFGAMTLGSALWGKVASAEGLPTTLMIAAAGALIGMLATSSRKLQTAAALDLTPSLHWRDRTFAQPVDDDQGPVLVSIEYRVDPADRAPFLEAMQEIGFERKRDGAFAWNVFEDTADVGRIVEIFLIQSLLELRHLRARVTKADQIVEAEAHKFLKEPPNATFLIAPKRNREKRRRLAAVLQPATVER